MSEARLVSPPAADRMVSPPLIFWLWLLGCCCYVSPGAPWVRQSPDVLVPEGDTLTLSCCWTLEARRFLVTWLKNGSVLKVLQKINPFGPLETSDCLNLTLTEVSQEASGSYTCRVLTELPDYSSLEGGVTTVTVEDDRRTPPADSPQQVGVVQEVCGLLLRSLPFLALLLTFFCINRLGAAAPRAPFQPSAPLALKGDGGAK